MGDWSEQAVAVEIALAGTSVEGSCLNRLFLEEATDIGWYGRQGSSTWLTAALTWAPSGT